MKYILYLGLIFLTQHAVADVWTAQKLAFLNWGTGYHQVAMIPSSPIHIGPPSLAIDSSGKLLSILDAQNQRIITVNTQTTQVSSLSYYEQGAIDFCRTDADDFVVLFAQKVVTYQGNGHMIQSKKIKNNPLSIQCLDQGKWRVNTFETQNDNNTIHINNSQQGSINLHHQGQEYTIPIKSIYGDLVLIDLLGIAQHVYVTVEETTDADHVIRSLRKYTLNGKLIAHIKIPYSVYAYTLKDIIVSAQGDIYQMLAHKNALKIIKWHQKASRAAHSTLDLFSYTEEHAGDFEPTETVQATRSALPYLVPDKQTPISRLQITQLAKKYANHRFNVSPNNLTSSVGTWFGRKKVTTPIRQSGYYVGVPYKWGGSDTLSAFNKGLNVGKKAGDICARSCSKLGFGSSQAVGVDCSGFISRVWHLKSHYNTSRLPKISKKLASKNDLRPGDILNRPGHHVMLFDHKDARGHFYVYEAVAGRIGKVMMRSHPPRNLSRYQPYRYIKFSDSTPPKLPKTKLDISVVALSANGDNEIQRITAQSILQSGDYYKIIFTPTENTYVYIFQVDSAGFIQQHFPKKGSHIQTKAGQTYFVPSQEQWFFLDDTTGEEKIYVIVSHVPDTISLIESALNKHITSQPTKKTRGSGGIASRPIFGKFTWIENGSSFSTKLQRIDIEGGKIWRFQHR
ncbi:MAG: DUF4384 domain-containing protein [Thiomargarita sp.]|nr:DUF4384 domain-containing protein [Thiomargarita sp.]